MFKPLIVTALATGLLSLVACDDKPCDTGACDSAVSSDDTGGGDDTSSGDYTGADTISNVSWGCDDLGYFFEIVYLGWSQSSDLWFAQTTTSAWTEVHTVAPSSQDATGWVSEYNFALDSVYDDGIGAVIEGTTTFFDCTHI